MTAIKLVSETRDTVTIRRRDFDALIDAAETSDDIALIDDRRAREKELGKARARRDYLTEAEMQRLSDGENRIRVWREKRGVPQGALASAIGVAASYLAEVEKSNKPGSTDLYRRVAAFLELPLESLLPVTPPAGELPMTRSDQAAQRLMQKAEAGANSDEMVTESHAIVAEWLESADKEGATSQLKAMIWRLRTTVTQLDSARRLAEQQDTISNIGATKRVDKISNAVETAIDALSREARKL